MSLMMEAEITMRLLAFLRDKKKYPDESLASEYLLPSRSEKSRIMAIDVAVVNTRSGIPVAVFEVKSVNSPEIASRAVEQLKCICATLQHPVRSYIVLPSNDADGFVVADVTRNIAEGLDCGAALEFWRGNEMLHKLPSYDLLVQGLEFRMESINEQTRKGHIDELKRCSQIMGGVLALIFFIDFIAHRAMLRWEDLSVLAAIAIIVLMPYYDGIKFNGVSIFRKKEERQADSKQDKYE